MSDSTDSELEIVNPSPVGAHNDSSVEQKAKEKRKRDHLSSVDAEHMPSNLIMRIFTQKKANYLANFVVFEWIIPAICFECSLRRWYPQKTKGASSLNRSYSGFNIYYITGSKWSSLWHINTNFGLGSTGSKLSLNAISSPLMQKFLSKQIPSGGSFPQRDGLSLYLKDCYKSDKEKLKSSLKNKEVMVFYHETTNSAARNVCVSAISVVPHAGTDIQSHLAKKIFERSILVAKFLIPNFFGIDCFDGSIPALLVTRFFSKIFVQKRNQIRISGMDPGQTCLFCQKSEELMDFWWGFLYVLNVSSPITTRSCFLTGCLLIRKQVRNFCFCIVVVIPVEFISGIDSFLLLIIPRNSAYLANFGDFGAQFYPDHPHPALHNFQNIPV